MAKRKQDGLYRRGAVFCFRYKDGSGCWKENSTGYTEREEAGAADLRVRSRFGHDEP